MSTDPGTESEQRTTELAHSAVDGLTRRDVMVRASAAGTLLLLPGVLAACGTEGSSSEASAIEGEASSAEIDHLTWGVGGATPTSLDIAKDLTAGQASFLGLEGLLATNSDLEYTPALASSWSQPDPLHYEFRIRSGVKFWDGSPLTVEDAVFSINRHLDQEVASIISGYFVNVASVEATDDQTLVVAMATPDPTLPGVLTFTHIQPRKFLERLGGGVGDPGPEPTVMGTGPFRITSFTTERGVEVERNDAYWGNAPQVLAATLNWFDEPQTMLLALRSGEINGVFGFPLSDADTWTGLSDVGTGFLKEDGLNVVFLSFNLEVAPFDDIHVRRAVAHCCDTQGYVNAFLGGEAEPATTIVPPAMWANVASPDEVDAIYEQIPQYPFDLEAARSELAQSGSPDGFSATIVYPSSYPHVGKALVSLSETLEDIGITLEVKRVTESQWLSGLGDKDRGVQPLIFLPDYPDPSNEPTVFLGPDNLANLKSEDVDRWLKQQAETTDTAERARLLGNVLRYSGEQLPYVPLWWEGSTVAVQDEYVYNGFNGLYYYQPWLASVGMRA